MEVMNSVVADDFTQRKQTEEQLLEGESKYRLIADHMSDLICVLDVSGVILYASPSHQTVLGFSPTVYEGVSTFNFIHIEDLPKVQQKFVKILETKVSWQAEFRYLHVDGGWIFIESNGKPVLDADGNVEKVVVVSRDITERKQAEEQLLRSEKLAVVGQMAAGVAHEIRNPLTSLKGFLQLLALNDDNANYCAIMLSEVNRINRIISEFLMIAKPQAQILKPTSIQDRLHDVFEVFDTNAIMNNVQITFEHDENIPLVTVDENQLKQVFINILKNAIDAMPNGGEISVEERLCNENKIMIRVIDRGCGISKERLSKIGEPFYTTKENGTGLGLMVSKRIIEMHNGQFMIMSEEGVGTIVEIVLPIQQG